MLTFEEEGHAGATFEGEVSVTNGQLSHRELLALESTGDGRPVTKAGAFLDAVTIGELPPGFEAVGGSLIAAGFAMLPM